MGGHGGSEEKSSSFTGACTVVETQQLSRSDWKKLTPYRSRHEDGPCPRLLPLRRQLLVAPIAHRQRQRDAFTAGAEASDKAGKWKVALPGVKLITIKGTAGSSSLQVIDATQDVLEKEIDGKAFRTQKTAALYLLESPIPHDENSLHRGCIGEIKGLRTYTDP